MAGEPPTHSTQRGPCPADPVRAAEALEPPAAERERVWAELLRRHAHEVGDVLSRREDWINGGADRQDAAVAWVVGRLHPVFTYVATAVYRCGSAAHRIATLRHAASGVELNLLPGGAFKLAGERLLHVPPFLCGRFPVTQEEWDRVGGVWDDRRQRGARLPIDRVSHEAVKAWLRKAGDGLRLPSEVEWEYACRAGTDTLFFWGDQVDPRYCWEGRPSTSSAHDVDALADRPNAFGLVDVLGNVREWCEDVWNETLDGGPYDHAPMASGARARGHVLRGGGAAAFPVATTCAYREASGAWSATSLPEAATGVGFRVVASLPFVPPRSAPPAAPEPGPARDGGDPSPTRRAVLDRLRGLLGGGP